MASRRIVKQLQNMRRDWNRRARENARYYVATGREEWSEEEFYNSGEATLREEILSDLGNVCQGRDPKDMTVLEIGCGAGRVTRALAGFFGKVYAVDISSEMVRRARSALRDYPNAQVFRNNGKDLSAIRGGWWQRLAKKQKEIRFDFAFSCIVFQHIPSREIIENYVREVNRVLKPGALFKFQVQGYATVEVKPGDTWVGMPYTRREAIEMAERCGFEMRYDLGEGGQYYWLWFFKKKDVNGFAD